MTGLQHAALGDEPRPGVQRARCSGFGSTRCSPYPIVGCVHALLARVRRGWDAGAARSRAALGVGRPAPGAQWRPEESLRETAGRRVRGARRTMPISAGSASRGSRSPCPWRRRRGTRRPGCRRPATAVGDRLVRIAARSWNSVRTQPGAQRGHRHPGAGELVGQPLGVGGRPGLDGGVAAHGQEPGGAGDVDDRARAPGSRIARPAAPPGSRRRGPSRRRRARAAWCPRR